MESYSLQKYSFCEAKKSHAELKDPHIFKH